MATQVEILNFNAPDGVFVLPQQVVFGPGGRKTDEYAPVANGKLLLAVGKSNLPPRSAQQADIRPLWVDIEHGQRIYLESGGRAGTASIKNRGTIRPVRVKIQRRKNRGAKWTQLEVHGFIPPGSVIDAYVEENQRFLIEET